MTHSTPIISHVMPYWLDVSQKARWSVLLRLLATPSVTKILYNTQVAMLAVDAACARCLPPNTHTGDLCAAFDPRIAVHLCDTTSSDEDLELRRICDRCGPSYRVPSYCSPLEMDP